MPLVTFIPFQPATSESMPARPRRAASVSLVLPAYNEQEVIEQAILEADEALAEITDDYEILVIDDGSRDATRERALCAAKHRPAVRVISHETNRGYGAALRTGFQAATKDYVGFSDADCQFNLRETNRLTLLLADCDIACGYRIDRQDKWHRIVYSQGLQRARSAAAGNRCSRLRLCPENVSTRDVGRTYRLRRTVF